MPSSSRDTRCCRPSERSAPCEEKLVSVTVTIVEHPVVADALARIRDAATPNALFRQNLERIGSLLLVRATEGLPTYDTTVRTPLTDAPARRLAVQPIVVPILRAGLGFVHAAQRSEERRVGKECRSRWAVES